MMALPPTTRRTIGSSHHRRLFSRNIGILQNSSGDYGDYDDADGPEDEISSEYDDPDGVPLFDTNEMRGGATLFGLEPNSDLDPLDNGLQFTGPIVMLFSIYVTLSLFFADDMPPLDL